MCAPIALGVATAVTGIVGSIGSYSQAQAQASYQNQIQQQQYELQMRAFQQQRESANRQLELNQRAASRSYMAEQQKIVASYQRAALEADELRLDSMRSASTIQASGKSGRSIGVLAMDPAREYGRDLAVLGLNLGFAREDYFTSIGTIFDQATTANNQVASSMMAEPVKPTKVAGPSSLGLITGIGTAGISGYETYSSLQPPL
jgi:hypothetical protein